MQNHPFDSRDKVYKQNVGAVAANSPLRLRLLLHKDAHVQSAYLKICKDGNEPFEVFMLPAEQQGDYRFYECTVTLDVGLYWYSFFYDSDFGRMFVTKGNGSVGIISADGKNWQQTVYNPNFKTPDWLLGNIIYQIFPDRFYNSGKPKCNVPNDRYIQADWLAQPAYKQDTTPHALGNDYYCGDLEGVRKKLPYLKDLGVGLIYLNPIFEAHSNHRYNTADYMKIDSLLGNKRDLARLCHDAKKHGIRIILDGVFSHTGDDSRYFNKYGRYDDLGAYQSEDSPYKSWFTFENYPDKYTAWWGIPSLPETNENNPDFTKFITEKNGVIEYWTKLGISGWRLDVADELPDEFLEEIRTCLKTCDPNAYLLGEVWEDATNKISYNKRRKFLLGNQLDSVMNYPFANAIVDFVKGGNADNLCKTVLDICENYPPQSLHTLMNHIGSHDTARILTRLGGKEISTRDEQAVTSLSDYEYSIAKRRLRCAVVLQFTLPGVPSIYYGDEVGMQGYGDPFCRGAYPWGNEDNEILNFYQTIGKIRRESTAFRMGDFVPYICRLGLFSFERRSENEDLFIAVNRWHESDSVSLPEEYINGEVLLGEIKDNSAVLAPYGAVIIKKIKPKY